MNISSHVEDYVRGDLDGSSVVMASIVFTVAIAIIRHMSEHLYNAETSNPIVLQDVQVKSVRSFSLESYIAEIEGFRGRKGLICEYIPLIKILPEEDQIALIEFFRNLHIEDVRAICLGLPVLLGGLDSEGEKIEVLQAACFFFQESTYPCAVTLVDKLKGLTGKERCLILENTLKPSSLISLSYLGVELLESFWKDVSQEPNRIDFVFRFPKCLELVRRKCYWLDTPLGKQFVVSVISWLTKLRYKEEKSLCVLRESINLFVHNNDGSDYEDYMKSFIKNSNFIKKIVGFGDFSWCYRFAPDLFKIVIFLSSIESNVRNESVDTISGLKEYFLRYKSNLSFNDFIQEILVDVWAQDFSRENIFSNHN